MKMKPPACAAFAAILLLLPMAVSAAIISVEVNRELSGTYKTIDIQNSNGLVKIVSELHNTGSLGYSGRQRLDAYMGDGVTQTAWSHSVNLPPGERGAFESYLYAGRTAGATITPRVYYGNEIFLEPNMTVMNRDASPAEDSFVMYDFRTYEDRVRFDLKPSADVNGVVIIPDGYPPGWLVEQATTGPIKAGRDAEVVLNYRPDLFSDNTIRIMAISEDGMHYSEAVFEMRMESGLSKYMNILADSVKALFRLVFQ